MSSVSLRATSPLLSGEIKCMDHIVSLYAAGMQLQSSNPVIHICSEMYFSQLPRRKK